MSGALNFGQEESRSDVDIIHPYKGTALEGLMNPFVAQLLGLAGQQTPYTMQHGPNKGTEIAPAANPLAGIPAAPQNLLDPAQLGANEQAMLDQLMAQTQGGGGKAGAPAMREAEMRKTMSGGYLGKNPFLQQAIKAATRPIQQDLAIQLERSLPGRFTQAGQFTQPGGSSAFDRAAAIATRGAANAMKDVSGQIAFGAYESERNRQGQAVEQGQREQALATEMRQTEVKNTLSNLQAQALPRLIQQHGLDLGMQEFRRQTDMLMNVLALITGVPGAFPSAGTESRGSGFNFGTKGGVGGA